MSNTKTIIIAGCETCPALYRCGKGFGMCNLSDGHDPMFVIKGNEPTPEWCPLKSGSVLIGLEGTEGDDIGVFDGVGYVNIDHYVQCDQCGSIHLISARGGGPPMNRLGRYGARRVDRDHEPTSKNMVGF